MGTHFFSPANVMQLLENVRGSLTSDLTIATCMNWGKTIGKKVILVGNCYGFVGNRMVALYGGAARTMLERGVTPSQGAKWGGEKKRCIRTVCCVLCAVCGVLCAVRCALCTVYCVLCDVCTIANTKHYFISLLLPLLRPLLRPLLPPPTPPSQSGLSGAEFRYADGADRDGRHGRP